MYPPVVNDAALYRAVRPLIGGNVAPFEKRMIAEDFAYYGKHLPALFMGIGARSEAKGFTAELHTPAFGFDEKVLLRGLETDLAIIAGVRPSAYHRHRPPSQGADRAAAIPVPPEPDG